MVEFWNHNPIVIGSSPVLTILIKKKHMLKKLNKYIKTFFQEFCVSNQIFESRKEKNPERDSFLRYYGYSLIIFSFVSFCIPNVWTFTLFSILGYAYYYAFFFVVFLKATMLLEEIYLIRDFLVESNWVFSPILMFKTGAVALKACATCVGGFAAAGAAVDYRITELSAVRDHQGQVHKCSPSNTIISYIGGYKTTEELSEGVLNSKAVARKLADEANKDATKFEKFKLDNKIKLEELKLDNKIKIEEFKRDNRIKLIKEQKKWY